MLLIVLFALSGWALVVLTAPVQGASEEKPSPELLKLGKELFNHTKANLGTKFDCILCHQKEKAIKREKVIKLGDGLADVINMHFVEKAKGKPIAKDGQEMKALEAYIRYEHSI